jgi:hypothetical protein
MGKMSIGSIQGWDIQKECLAPKWLSKHYFEWPIHLQNKKFGKFFSLLVTHILFY